MARDGSGEAREGYATSITANILANKEEEETEKTRKAFDAQFTAGKSIRKELLEIHGIARTTGRKRRAEANESRMDRGRKRVKPSSSATLSDFLCS